METTVERSVDFKAIVDKAEEVAWLVMEEATKEGGLHMAPSARAIGASVKFIRGARETYKGNPIVEGVIDRISRQRGKPEAMVDVKELSSALVMAKVDSLMPLLEAEGEHGAQTRAFIYALAETMVSASGSGFLGTGERVNEGEARFLADLKMHLII
jgi:hypothetical protein